MIKTLYTTVAILSLSAFAAPVQKKAPVALAEKAQVIVIENSYLKNDEKKLKLIKKKIEILEGRDQLSSKSEQKLESLKQQKNKIFFWKKYLQYMQKRISILSSGVREPYKKMSKLDRAILPLLNNYEKLTGQAFPKDYFKKAKIVEAKLKAPKKK